MTTETRLSARRGLDDSERHLPISPASHAPDANYICMYVRDL